MTPASRRIFGIIAFLTLWQASSTVNVLDPALFPSLAEVAAALATLISLTGERSAVADLGATLWRLVVSMTWAVLIAVPAGLLLGVKARLDEYAGLLIDFFRSLPATAMFPVFLLFFGLGEGSKIGVTAFSSGLVILVGATHAVRQIRPLRLEAAEICGAGGWTLFSRIILPAAAPGIAIAIRTAVSIALIVVIVTEMFAGTESGLGWRIFAARESFRVPELYALLIVTGATGASISAILHRIERRAIHWSGH